MLVPRKEDTRGGVTELDAAKQDLLNQFGENGLGRAQVAGEGSNQLPIWKGFGNDDQHARNCFRFVSSIQFHLRMTIEVLYWAVQASLVVRRGW